MGMRVPWVPILLLYHSHKKNPLKYGNGMGPAYGKGVPLVRVPEKFTDRTQMTHIWSGEGLVLEG